MFEWPLNLDYVTTYSSNFIKRPISHSTLFRLTLSPTERFSFLLLLRGRQKFDIALNSIQKLNEPPTHQFQITHKHAFPTAHNENVFLITIFNLLKKLHYNMMSYCLQESGSLWRRK